MSLRNVLYYPLLRTESRAAGAFNQKAVEGVGLQRMNVLGTEG